MNMNYEHLWPDRPIIMYFIQSYKFSVSCLNFYRNGVTQTEMPVK